MEFAFVFPGQGSQAVGMVAALAESYPVVKQTFEEASDAISLDLWKLVTAGPEDQLNQTSNTQPAMLSASYATWQIWNSVTDVKPKVMAGHSFGEISALTCGGAISFVDAVKIARKRGELMQNAVPAGTGAMAAVLGLQDEQLNELCRAISAEDKVVEAVNYNAPGQVVVAGHVAGVDQLIEEAKQNGAKRALKLPVSVPAHSSLMQPASELFAQVIAKVDMNVPQPGVIQNATLEMAENPTQIKAALQAQLHSPVQWVQTIHNMRDQGIGLLLEIGPGKVLTGLHKRIDKSVKSVCICDNASLETAIKAIEE